LVYKPIENRAHNPAPRDRHPGQESKGEAEVGTLINAFRFAENVGEGIHKQVGQENGSGRTSFSSLDSSIVTI
jgi:hypothetical protein